MQDENGEVMGPDSVGSWRPQQGIWIFFFLGTVSNDIRFKAGEWHDVK